MKIASWNVNSLRVRLQHVIDWLIDNPVDALALQETKLTDDKFPHEELAEAGWKAAAFGQKTYNGVALISRESASNIVTGMDDGQARVIIGTVAGVRVACCYVPNGQEVGSEKYAYKLAWLQQFRALIKNELAQHEQCVVLGDFNIAPTPEDTHDPDVWEGKILCSDAERAELKALLELGLTDPFDAQTHGEDRFTWWDYRAAGFRRNLGLRIDHILVSKAVRARLTSWEIDKTPRRWERPSDHTPVIITLN